MILDIAMKISAILAAAKDKDNTPAFDKLVKSGDEKLPEYVGQLLSWLFLNNCGNKAKNIPSG